MPSHRKTALPGFGLSLGVTVTWLGLIVLLPLAALVLKTSALGGASFWEAAASRRALAAYRLSFGASLVAACFNTVFGLLLAWVLERYRFPGRRLVDALVDLPFALPTAVAGISLATLYAPDGWFGALLEPLGLRVAFGPLGVVVALVFVGLPFVVRTVQPVLETLDGSLEEAAAVLGATRWQTFCKVVFPGLAAPLLTGFSLAFARGLGEYGSVIFIAGNMPLRSEIAPLVIVTRLEQYDDAGAAVMAVVMLAASFLALSTTNFVQRFGRLARSRS